MNRKKILIVFFAFACLLLLSCGDGGSSGGEKTEEVKTKDLFLILAKYNNIYFEAIPYDEKELYTTQYGYQWAKSTTACFSMPMVKEYGWLSSARTFFYTCISSDDGDYSDNFSEYILELDYNNNSEIDFSNIVDIGMTDIKNIVGNVEKTLNTVFLSIIDNNTPLPKNNTIHFWLTGGVKGEDKKYFKKILGGYIVIYDWKHIKLYVDGAIHELDKRDLTEKGNIVFRKAVCYVSMTNNKEDANCVLVFTDPYNHGNIFSGLDSSKDFIVRGNTVYISCYSGKSTILIGLIAIATRFGLVQKDVNISHDNLMYKNIINTANWNRITLNEEQWNTLNRNVR